MLRHFEQTFEIGRPIRGTFLSTAFFSPRRSIIRFGSKGRVKPVSAIRFSDDDDDDDAIFVKEEIVRGNELSDFFQRGDDWV